MVDVKSYGPYLVNLNGRDLEGFAYLNLKGSVFSLLSIDTEAVLLKFSVCSITRVKSSFDFDQSLPFLKINCQRILCFLKCFPVSQKDSILFPEIIEEVEEFQCQVICSVFRSNFQGYKQALMAEFEWIFEKEGISENWRFSLANQSYALCSTYSQVLAIPKSITDTVLLHASHFRVRQRIPLLSYIYKGRALIRSGQPLVGLTQKRCIQDEKLIEALKLACCPSDSRRLLIVDARPTTAALANAVIGAGVERLECYEGSERIYLNLENIHGIREAHDRLCEDVKVIVKTGAHESRALWIEVEEKCSWLDHLRVILEGTAKIVEALGSQSSHVLVHCSDGWDRTSQLISLTQLCLDQRYRSQEGFLRLILKDWLAAGHRFSERSGLKSDSTEAALPSQQSPWSSLKKFFDFDSQKKYPSSSSSDHECPIFLQFIESVIQLCRQNPLHFPELTDDFLLKIVDAAMTGDSIADWDLDFGGNCEADRQLEQNEEHLEESKDASSISSDDGKISNIINPSYDRCKMILWPAFYKRFF